MADSERTKRGEDAIVAPSLMDTLCGLLLDSGGFSAIDVLRALGLLEEDPEATRDTVALSAIQRDVEEGPGLLALLRETRELAADLGLEVGESDGEGLCGAGDDRELHALLRSTWRPPTGRRQLDIFVDSAPALAIQAVRDALLARNAATARRELERLSGQVGAHRSTAQAEALIVALEAAPVGAPTEAPERLARLEHDWLPAASAFLGRAAREFLAPLWRDVARALEDAPYDPTRPGPHASRAWARCGDHEAVIRTVRATPGHDSNPDLLGTLADAFFRLHERPAAMECWFALCRLDPGAFERRIRAPDFPDRATARAWREARNSDALEEDLAAAWFPAWVLIAAPTLAPSLPEASGDDAPSRAFNVLRALQREHGSPRVGLREELRTLHSGLFDAYMATVGSRG